MYLCSLMIYVGLFQKVPTQVISINQVQKRLLPTFFYGQYFDLRVKKDQCTFGSTSLVKDTKRVGGRKHILVKLPTKKGFKRSWQNLSHVSFYHQTEICRRLCRKPFSALSKSQLSIFMRHSKCQKPLHTPHALILSDETNSYTSERSKEIIRH